VGISKELWAGETGNRGLYENHEVHQGSMKPATIIGAGSFTWGIVDFR